MQIKGIIDEDFVNYKVVSMFISLGTCDWKCCKEAGIPINICQNCSLAKQKDIEISTKDLFNRYSSNPISQAVVIGGLEPITKWNDIVDLIQYFRDRNCYDTFVIYTGYYKSEIIDKIEYCREHFKNVVFKFGRFKPNQDKHYDNILGVDLISDNQYGEIIC